jgi:hypothetical protein
MEVMLPRVQYFDHQRRIVMKKITHIAGITLLICTQSALGQTPNQTSAQDGMTDMSPRAGATAEDSQRIDKRPHVRLPMIAGYHEGRKVWFIHTEASEQKMAKMLTKMVDYPTTYAPALGKVEKDEAGKIYVFKNGISGKGIEAWGGGPFNQQIDVLDSVPSDEGYTPLRIPQFVTWKEGATPRVLRSEKEILEAERAGELTIKTSDVVVNAPVVYPDGERPALKSAEVP